MTARETKPELAGLNLQGDFKLAHSGDLVDLLEASAAQQPAEMIDIFNLNARGAQDKAQLFVTAHTGERTSLSGIAAGSNSTLADKEKREKDEKRRLEDALYRMLLDAREWSEQLGREIDDMEAGFASQYGDAWREHMATSLLDPEVMQRREGESVAEYRQRLEVELTKTLLNEDGSIKDEYKSGPYAEWAIWAQKQHQKRGVDQFLDRQNDPTIPQSQKLAEAEVFAKNADFNELVRSDAELAGQSQTQIPIEKAKAEMTYDYIGGASSQAALDAFTKSS